ncbi:hypothetical protein E0H73_09050 [Kribbella pittospori]|uniref:Uncharacterized protein n=1 Tax=Kribbella pittospori TaxID=722689 RepID=A0A4V2MBU6_9ACTN|nr:hypothetical protein [Kribbella pittospori]TCC64522.1 hypothetical protein E0H73_09050 [Kribbella pittospori]
MIFEVNGYRLSHLVKDPAAVDLALTRLAVLLADARTHMQQLDRHDLADRLDELSRQLQTQGAAIDDTFDEAFREVTDAAAEACETAAGPDGMQTLDDPNAHLYQALTWGVVHLVVIRIGGHGTLEHRSTNADQGQ